MKVRQRLIDFFKGIYPEAYHIEDAAYILSVKGADELNAFMEEAHHLADKGILYTRDYIFYSYAQPQKENYVEGIYKGYRKSFGFVITPDGEEDVYISENNRHSAMHNDTVRVRILSDRESSRKKEGSVIDILERANKNIVGTYDRQKNFGFVTPIDERMGDDVYVELKDSMNARSGAKVMVQITKWPKEHKKAEGKIIEILGYEGDQGLDINLIMANYKIPFSFPDKVLAESKNIDFTIKENPKRWDLRNIQIITIDGEDAKDLDDGVSCQVLDNGNYQLGVHIADVSHYVRPSSEIDKEAYKRGTSVYLVDRVVPMLPQVLSNGICSLNAHEERYAMTCMMEINSQGKVLKYKIRPSIIKVGRRCSYKEIYKALDQDIIPDDLQVYMEMIRNLYEVSKILNAMRHRRGALDFDFPEYRVMLDIDGTPLRIVKRDRTLAERLIEECMLIANETVATHLKNTNRASVYRIHERPSEEKLNNLGTVLTYLGKSTHFDFETVKPRDIQEFLDTVKDTDIEQIAQIMTLRSMKQAKYSIENVGHFGLASECYTHFTSPIRRYPDLMVHRLLKADLKWENGYSKRDIMEDFLAKGAEHSSVQEQNAVAAERDTDDLKKVQYMLPFVGQVFTGKVNSITSFGMFVELDNGIDGLVHINMMEDDYYFYDEEHFLLVGKRSGKTYHLGQEVVVTLVKADVAKRQIDFVLGTIDNLADLQARMETSINGRGRNMAQSLSRRGRSGDKANSKSGKKSHATSPFYKDKTKGSFKKKKNNHKKEHHHDNNSYSSRGKEGTKGKKKKNRKGRKFNR